MFYLKVNPGVNDSPFPEDKTTIICKRVRNTKEEEKKEPVITFKSFAHVVIDVYNAFKMLSK